MKGQRTMKCRVNWSDPYRERQGEWLKGNLHAHTREGSPCGTMPLNEVLAAYAGKGYDFLAISDHMSVRPLRDRRLLLIPGVEWNAPQGEHTGVYSFNPRVLKRAIGINDQQLLLHELADEEALVILNHPNWEEPPHYSREQLREKRFFHGIEIYNAVIERLAGTALATDKWDYLLARNQRALGFASDDSHGEGDIGQAWLMARCRQRTAAAVFEALQTGNFYCSSGVTITDIRRSGSVITVETADAQEIQVIGRGGIRLARVLAPWMKYDVAGLGMPYVRFVAYGRGSAMAWTQPFFLSREPQSARWLSPFVTSWKMSRLIPKRKDVSAARPVSLSRKLDWLDIRAQGSPEGFVNLHWHYQNLDGVVYLANRFLVQRAGRWRIRLGHDGGAKLFVDGRNVLCEPVRINPAMPNRSQIEVLLRRGIHEIVVAFDTADGRGWGIFFEFEVPEAERKKGRKPAFPKLLGS